MPFFRLERISVNRQKRQHFGSRRFLPVETRLNVIQKGRNNADAGNLPLIGPLLTDSPREPDKSRRWL